MFHVCCGSLKHNLIGGIMVVPNVMPSQSLLIQMIPTAHSFVQFAKKHLTEPNQSMYSDHFIEAWKQTFTNFLFLPWMNFRMKLTFTAKDDSGTALVTFWDELATQLMGKTVIQLKQELPEVLTNEIFLPAQ